MRVVLLSLILMLSFYANSQDKCTGEFQVVVHKGDTIAVDCDRMVLMNPETFAMYYHDSKALEGLRKDIPEWAATIDSLKQLHKQNRLEIDSISTIRKEQINLERESKEEVIEELIVAENENTKLKKENRWWKRFSAGSSGLSLVLLLILI